MRLIDADVLEKEIENAIKLQKLMAETLEIEDDESVQAELKAYADILEGVKEQTTIPYDMKWNPDCEDCKPEDIRECILCRQR